MTRQELTWRARVVVRTGMQRVSGRMRPPRWDRESLRRVLHDRVTDAAVRRAMNAGDWQTAHEALFQLLAGRPSRFALDHSCAGALVDEVRRRWPDAPSDAAARADRILAGRYDILGYQGLTFARNGLDVDWHLDPLHERRAPATFWADVPYLDPAIGDHKIIWEINRHQHWLQLGRALWLTGDARYGRAIVERFESWLPANPPLAGINWASMLEIGLRALSWIWALHFLLADGRADSGSRTGRTGADEAPWLVDMLVAIDRQLTHVEQNLSFYFSPNTHLTGEALALYVVGVALPELAASDRWIQRGREILLGEIDHQIHADGGHAEGSTHYHRYTLDIYLLALLTATRAQDVEATRRFADAVARLAAFARAVADDRGLFPLIGDDDGGMLWPIMGRACCDVRDSLALAAVLLEQPDLAPWGIPEEVFWVGGRTAIDRAGLVAPQHDTKPPRTKPNAPSRLFADSGYFVARDADGNHAVFDVGRHGYLNAGHAHADALAITLTLSHRPLLVDPGTSTYVDRAVRDRMRDTASHNTVTIDGRPQSIPGDPFHWKTRSDARLHASRHNPAFDWAEASHDGYAALRHRRTFLRSSSGWLVVDEILGTGPHVANAYWHFDPDWTVTADSTSRLRAVHADGSCAWLLHDTGAAVLMRGDETTGLGWYAGVYGQLEPAWVARLSRTGHAPFDFVTWIGRAVDGRAPSLERVVAASDPGSAAIAARVGVDGRASVFLLRPGEPPWRETRSAATSDYRTNGRLLHYSTQAGALAALDLVDASELVALHDGWLSLTAEPPAAELHISFDGRAMDLRAAEPPARLRLQGDILTTLGAIRLNGRECSITPTGDPGITIDSSQWTSSQPDATSLSFPFLQDV
jgi:heparinase II/III-like protein